LWARVQNLKIAQIEKALNERALVKAGCMRRTLFLVPSEHLAVFVRGSARRAEKEIRWARGKGVPDRVLDAAIQAALAVLDEPLTRVEIAERVSRKLGVQEHTVHGGGWGSNRKLAAVPVGHLIYPVVDLLHLTAARGVVCYGPSRGNEPTFVRADAWIPKWKDISQGQAENLLLRCYLRAFAPATPADFARWVGITLTDAREIWARQQADLAPVNVEGWPAEILRDDLAELTRAKFDQPHVCLLPYFDTFLLGHERRTHLIAPKHHSKVYRAQGWIVPVVLVNGRVAAVWEQVREGDRIRINVKKFESISRPVIVRIHEEARGLARFLGAADAVVQVE